MKLNRRQLRKIIITETRRISRQQMHESYGSYSGEFYGTDQIREPEPERREKSVPGERYAMKRDYTDSDIRQLYADLYGSLFGNELSNKIIDDVMNRNLGSVRATNVAAKILIGIYESLAKGLIESADALDSADTLLKDLAMGLSYNLAFNGHIPAPKRMITDADVDEIYKLNGGRMTSSQFG